MSTNASTETIVRTLPQMKEAAAKGEVSFSAYEHARNFCADANTDHDWWDCTVETWKNALAEIGFLDADIQFSGFWSQGDGASFTASVDAEKIISLFVAPPAPLDQISVDADEKEVFAPWLMRKVGGVRRREDFAALLPLAKDGELEISMHRISRHYSHPRTVGIDLEYREPYSPDALESLTAAAANGGEIDYDYLTTHLRDAVESLYRDLCNALYVDLRDEYDYLTGEEAAIECAEANEYLFTENGSIHRGVVPVKENP